MTRIKARAGGKISSAKNGFPKSMLSNERMLTYNSGELDNFAKASGPILDSSETKPT